MRKKNKYSPVKEKNRKKKYKRAKEKIDVAKEVSSEMTNNKKRFKLYFVRVQHTIEKGIVIDVLELVSDIDQKFSKKELECFEQLQSNKKLTPKSFCLN